MIRRRTARRATKRYSARQTCGMAAAGGPSRGTATPRERGSLRPASAKARRDELDQRWPRAPAPSAVSRATAGRRTRPRWRTRVRRAGRRTRHPGRPGAGQHGCRRRGSTRARQQTARSGVSTRRRTGRPQAGTRQMVLPRRAFRTPTRRDFSPPSALRRSQEGFHFAVLPLNTRKLPSADTEGHGSFLTSSLWTAWPSSRASPRAGDLPPEQANL